MFRLMIFCILLIAPSVAVADIFSDLEQGTWGFAPVPDMTCEENPSRIAFNADKSEIKFYWKTPIGNYYDPKPRKSRTYVVVAQKARRLTLQWPKDGSVLQNKRYILFLMRDGRRYRWKAADQPDSSFFDYFRRCEKA